MKKAIMKGKNVEDATEAGLKVLGGDEANAKVIVLSKGKSGMLGMIGSEEAEVEVILKEGKKIDTQQILQEILDKMGFIAIVDAKEEGDRVELSVKGEDLGRVIGKEGATLRSLELLVGSMASNLYNERVKVGIDAGDYREKRKQALERLAKDVADEVVKTGQEKAMPYLDARDRRTVHMFLKDQKGIATESVGEGADRKLIVKPS